MLRHIQRRIQDIKCKGLLENIAKGCGPSIYNNDAYSVAGSDPKELETVKKNFLVGN